MVNCKICGHPLCSYAGVQRGIVVECSNYMPKPKPQTNADRMISMIQNGQVSDLLDWWQEILEDGVPSDDYFEWWLKQPVKDGEGDV